MLKHKFSATKRELIDDETGEVLDTIELTPQYNDGAAKIAKAMKIAMPLFKTPWNHDRDAASDQSATACPELTKANQSQKEEADINTIVGRFLKTGVLPQVPMPPRFADLPEMDFQDAMEAVNAGRRSFEALPAEIRADFRNDPALFLDYVDHCMDTGDLEPLRKMGLAVPEKPIDTPPATPTAPPVADSGKPPSEGGKN